MHDVVIVGGGPAGSAAAIVCAEHGLEVRLLENLRFPRDVAGETLHPGVESLLRQLGVADAVHESGFLRHRGSWVQWGEALPQFQPFGSDKAGPWFGFQAWRSEFDRLLLNRARELGVEIIQPARAIRLLVRNNEVFGIESSDGAVSGRWVIDAAGSRHWLARQKGLAVRQYSRKLLVSYGYVEGEASIYMDAPSIRLDDEGWTWIARVKPGLYQWTRLNGTGVPRELQRLTARGHIRGADVTWRMAAEPAGPGYFLVGDSAAVLDPASSHGVLRAIASGMMAGHLIAQMRNRKVSTEQAALYYRQWLSRSFHHDVTALTRLYAHAGLRV